MARVGDCDSVNADIDDQSSIRRIMRDIDSDDLTYHQQSIRPPEGGNGGDDNNRGCRNWQLVQEKSVMDNRLVSSSRVSRANTYTFRNYEGHHRGNAPVEIVELDEEPLQEKRPKQHKHTTEESSMNMNKRLKTACSSTEETKRDYHNLEGNANIPTGSGDEDEVIPCVCISEDHPASPLPLLTTLIVPEKRRTRQSPMPELHTQLGIESDSTDVVVTLRVRGNTSGQLIGMSSLRQKLINSIEAAAVSNLEEIHASASGQESAGQTDTDNNDTSADGREYTTFVGQIDRSSADEPGCSTASTSGSKRGLGDVYCDYSSDTNYDGTTSQDVMESVDPESPATLPVMMKYVLLEELLAADEAWHQLPKQVWPLQGRSHADMTDDDFCNLTQHGFTRIIKKHVYLNALKQMPLTDQVSLIKGKVRGACVVETATLHHLAQGTLHVDYPGCPQISDDIGKRFPGNTHQRLYRFGASYPERYRPDKVVTLILCMMAMFDGHHDTCRSLSETSRGDFREASNVYSALLRQHLEETYGEREANLSHQILTTWLNCVTIFAASFEHGETFELDPLTFTIFDLQFPFMKKR